MKKNSLRLKIFLILNFSFVFFAFNFKLTSAYTEATEGGQMIAEVYPQNPASFTNTSVRLISYEVDLEKSNIIWIINGKKQKEGFGENKIKFDTGEIGKKIVVDIEVASQDGKTITKKISIIPAETDIFWQSNGYVPPFYRGKSLVITGNDIKLTASPNLITESGARLGADKLFYSWRVNSKNFASGYGKNSIVSALTGSIFGDTFLVEVSSPDGVLKATKLLKLYPDTSNLLFYETNPLLGTIYENSILDGFEMKDIETTIRIEPFFLNTGQISYGWAVNDEIPVPSKDNKPEITIRQPASNNGESLLRVLINDAVEKSLKIKFGQKTTTF
jgi:hypothetical protein